MPPSRQRVALLLCLINPAASRTRTSFDASWLFRLGPYLPPGTNCSAASFPFSLSGIQCLNLQAIPSASSPAACLSACCAAAPSCALWQFAPSPGCWIGATCADNLTSPGWTGGASLAPATPTSCDPTMPCAVDFNDSDWRALSVPHDFIIEGAFDPDLNPSHAALPRNVSWYRKHFSVDADLNGSLLWLTFDGVFRSADVYLNGAFIMHHEEGYTTWTAYLHNASAALNYGGGDNVLAVYVDATQSELWAYEGGGIFRHVWFESAANVSVVPFGFFSPSVVTGNITGASASAAQSCDAALVMPQVDVQNSGSGAVIGTAAYTLQDGSGNTVASTSIPFNISAGGWARLTASVPFGSAAAPVQLWNIAPSPPLYNATIVLTDSSNGNVLDVLSVSTGVRRAVFDAKNGFILNDASVKITGVSMHVGFGGVGMAVPDRALEFQVAALRAMGANGWRTAHNPVAPELLTYADEYGMLVWEENRFVTAGVQPLMPSPTRMAPADSGLAQEHISPMGALLGAPTPPVLPNADPRMLQDAQDMVLRDRNHPSIIIWSLCNELGCVADDPMGAVLAVQFKESIYAADTSRPVTGNTVQPNYLSGHLVDPFARTMDVQSFSYNYDAYTQYHEDVPWKALGGGESGSCLSDRAYYGATNGTTGHISPSNVFSCTVDSWTPAATLPHVYGSFMWTGMAYYGEVYPLGWPDVSSHFGALDIAGFPKDVVGYYNAWWRDAAAGCSSNVSISISPSDWTAPATVGATIPVTVTTCAASVEVSVNGVSQGTTAVPPFAVATFPAIVFVPGNITAVAYDAVGAVVATQTVFTAGAAARLRATVDSPYRARNGSQITADGADVALISMALVDAAGTLVPNADVNVTVTISGPGALTGLVNGDPADHTLVKQSWRVTYGGLLRAIVASSAPGATGTISISFAAAGFALETVQVDAV